MNDDIPTTLTDAFFESGPLGRPTLSEAKVFARDLERRLAQVTTDVDYVGGVQYWISKHAEACMESLKLGRELADRDDALAKLATAREALETAEIMLHNLVPHYPTFQIELAEIKAALAATAPKQ